MLFLKILFIILWLADLAITRIMWPMLSKRGHYSTQTRGRALLTNAIINALILASIYTLINYF